MRTSIRTRATATRGTAVPVRAERARRSDERASARRGVHLDQRTRARRLRLRGEQPGATGPSAFLPGGSTAQAWAAVPA